MDDVTLQALKDSITKWEKNSRVRKIEEATVSSDDCPLCGLFSNKFTPDYADCAGCPVRERTGKRQCFDTPYYSARMLTWDVRDGKAALSDFHSAARAEVDFLKSLLPEAQS